MKKNNNFEIIEVSDEYIAIPMGEIAVSFHGVIVLSEPTAFLINHVSDDFEIDECVDVLTSEYDVDRATALEDVQTIIPKLLELTLIIDN